MLSVVRNRFFSAFSTVQRFVAAEHADLAQRACSSVHHRNAVYNSTISKVQMARYATNSILTNKNEIHELMAVWPDIVRDITESKIFQGIPDISEWMAKVLQYNVPGGKKNRGLALVYAYKLLAPKYELTKDNIRLAQILAWCVELVLAFFQVVDDIQDRSLIRRSQPCWYRHNDIGLAAFNDGILLESAVYFLIQKHFKGKECYVDLLETFQNITFMTATGQFLDLLSSNFGKKPNLDLFTMDRYSPIVKHKTAYCTYVLPITVAMHFAGIKDKEKLKLARTILLEMGHFFQIQDDYLDCYGKTELIGKDSTDIQKGKCTWLIVMALQRATPEQREILKKCYGISDPEKVQRVKQIYNDLNLSKYYCTYEEETYDQLNIRIQQLSHGLPHDVFLMLLNKLYRRTS